MSDLTLKLQNGNTLHGNRSDKGRWTLWVVCKETSKVVGKTESSLLELAGLLSWGSEQNTDIHKDCTG